MTKRFKLTSLDINNMIKLYNKGLSCNKIAVLYSVDRTTVRHHLISRGVKMRAITRKGIDSNFHRGGDFDSNMSSAACMRVKAALRKGILKRPSKCESCKQKKQTKNGKSGIQAHHCDYNKPLEVIWLCRKCHFIWHSKYEAIYKKPKNRVIVEGI